MEYMARALRLAERALGRTSPNPSVGAVIVRDGIIVGQGHTQPAGGPHAEILALRQAGDSARGATMYVSLEPCSHHGRTPPCTEAIVAAGLKKVHMAHIDPNPQVNGKGKNSLAAAGILVAEGDLADRALRHNEAYIKFITTGLPFITAKFAMSLDGKIATAQGESQWITGEPARRQVHRMRGSVDAIMVGIGTVLQDDPQLTSRNTNGRPQVRQPIRVVIDSQGRIPANARLLQQPGQVLVAVSSQAEREAEYISSPSVEVLRLGVTAEQRVDLLDLIRVLGERKVVSIMVEGGSTLLGSLFDLGLVDKVVAFISPIVIGGSGAASPIAGNGAKYLTESLHLGNMQIKRFEKDIMVTGYPSPQTTTCG